MVIILRIAISLLEHISFIGWWVRGSLLWRVVLKVSLDWLVRLLKESFFKRHMLLQDLQFIVIVFDINHDWFLIIGLMAIALEPIAITFSIELARIYILTAHFWLWWALSDNRLIVFDWFTISSSLYLIFEEEFLIVVVIDFKLVVVLTVLEVQEITCSSAIGFPIS